MEKLISIIIPIYNTSKTLLMECFDSINRQTYKNFECLLIDDGSNIKEVKQFLREYTDCNKKFALWETTENLGPGNARNIGIENSQGEIITFVDADDYVRENFLETIAGVFDKYPDLEIFSFENLIRLKTGAFRKSADYTFSTGVVNINSFNNGILDKCSVWAKAYSKKFIVEKKIYFLKENLFMEDLYYFIISYSRADRIVFSKDQLYILNDNENSRSRSEFTLKKAEEIFEVVKRAYYAVKDDDSYVQKNYAKLFNLWFFHKLKESDTDRIYGDNKEYRMLIERAINFRNSID